MVLTYKGPSKIMFKLQNRFSSSKLSFLFPFLLAACVGTELAFPASHPGNAAASSGTVPMLSGLHSDFDASGESRGTKDSSHAEHAEHAEHADADHPDAEHAEHADADPAGHADPAEAAPQPAKADAVYTCPMHPEIERSEPGRCPKCGMKLVPKKDKK